MQSQNIEYIGKLDHLRFFAAAIVVMFHAEVFRQIPAFSLPLFRQGHSAVALFMVTSGMILALICDGKRISIPRFYLNRILRIYPLFIAVVLLGRGPLVSLLPIVPRADFGAYGGHMWSIVAELQFYAIFPLLIMLPSKALAAIVVVACAARLVFFLETNTVHHVAYFTLLGNIDAFLVGILLARLYQRPRLSLPTWAPVAALVASAAIHWLVFEGEFFHVGSGAFGDISHSPMWIIWPDISALMWAILIFTYLRSKATLPLVFEHLGKWSYSLYVWHVLVLANLLKAGLYVPPYLLGLTALTITIAISALSYYVIERPFLLARVRYVGLRTAPAERATLP